MSKMHILLPILVAVVLPRCGVAALDHDGVVEFGEVRNVKSKKNKDESLLLLRKTDSHHRGLLKEDGAFWDNMSSMSYAPPTVAPVVTAPPVSCSPKPSIVGPSPMPVDYPSPEPSSGLFSDVPSQTPTVKGLIPPSPPTKKDPTHRSMNPTTTTTASNTLAPTTADASTTEDVVFKCSKNNVVIVVKPPSKTTINVNVGYMVETSAVLDDYINELEALILETATIGALQCGNGGPLFGLKGTPPQVSMFTSVTGDTKCPIDNSTKPSSPSSGSVCTILESNFQILIKEEIDPDFGAFLGYHKLQVAMDNGTFTKAIPILDHVEYLSPLPLVPTTNSPAPAPLDSDSSQLSVSRWTIGAAVAMCLGGTIAIGAWARNRRTRNQRHLQLMEESSSMASPSMPSPPEQAASPQE